MPESQQKINITVLKETVTDELLKRKSRWRRFRFAQNRGERTSFYGATGAINCHAILGIPYGSERQRREWAMVVRSYQKRSGSFPGGSPEHAAGMAIQALNLLGGDVPKNIAPLAPLDVAQFKDWLSATDWNSTHKRMWGGLIPLLVSGRVSSEWIETFIDVVVSRISMEKPLETWCSADDPPWKVISAIYHILAIFDAAGIPYPYPNLIGSRLLQLEWHKSRINSTTTLCTDGDWAWLLMEICKLQPDMFKESIEQIRSVSAQRAHEWNEGNVDITRLSTHHIYCYLWVSALFQHIDRSHFRGPWLHDTLNSPELFRF